MSNKKTYKKVGLLIFVTVLVILVAYIFLYKTHNYASDMVKPIRDSLIKQGARFACDGGDPGRGPDNTTPHYNAYFRVDKDPAEAITLLLKATQENGYNLTHATPSSHGPVDAVADSYIDKWYFDQTSKKSPYNDLKQGNVTLMAVVDGPGSEDSCNSGKTAIGNGQSLIGIEIRLPEYK